MKQIKKLFVLILLCIPMIAFGDGIDNIRTNEHTSRLLEQMDWLADFTDNELQIIEEKMRELNPQLVESSVNDSMNLKIIKYNNWMADHIYNEYHDYIMDDFYKRSQETGREIKTRYITNSDELGAFGIYHADMTESYLDEGIMESDECHIPKYKRRGHGCIAMEYDVKMWQKHTCLFPDGFEEYHVYNGGFGGNLSDMNGDPIEASLMLGINLSDCKHCSVQKQFVVLRDSKAEDTRVHCQIVLYGSSAVQDDSNGYTRFVLGSSCEMLSYTDWYTWRNNEQQDIIDGKHIGNCGPKPGARCALLYKFVDSCAHGGASGEEWINKWKSNRGIPARKYDRHIIGIGRRYVETYDSNSKDNQ